MKRLARASAIATANINSNSNININCGILPNYTRATVGKLLSAPTPVLAPHITTPRRTRRYSSRTFTVTVALAALATTALGTAVTLRMYTRGPNQ